MYDIANRLASVDTVSYTFDYNGNLLDDGVSTYTYDAANRLSAVSGPSSATYAYNGLGDRYEQTVSSQTTTYILDLNAGLTQVLDDGDNVYLYGLGRIAQVNSSTEYFVGDGLGSVRQLVESGDIVLAKSYAPYGEDLYSTGSGASAFAYTGEQTDPNGLVYLRARYYNSNDGRFTSRDTWGGNTNRPLSLNRWNYVEGNPINNTDPSGHCVRADGSIDYWGWPWGTKLTCWFEDKSQPPAQPTSTATATTTPTITPTCTSTPTLPPTVAPTPGCPVCSTNQYAKMLYDAVLKHKNDLPPGFSVALLFAVAAVETGGNNPAYQNSVTHGGAFQLRADSGHYNHPYEDSQAGYEQNVMDAIAVINENYYYADSTKEQTLWQVDLYRQFPDNQNGATAARTVLYYNGGFGWWDKNNRNSYVNNPTNKPYVGNVAGMLANYVPSSFGFSDPSLVTILQKVQNIVNVVVQ